MPSKVEKDISSLSEAVERNFKGMVLSRLYDFGKDYLMVLDYKTRKEDEFLYDPFYTVNKKTFKLAGFSPTMNIELFKKTMKSKPLYSRGT